MNKHKERTAHNISVDDAESAFHKTEKLMRCVLAVPKTVVTKDNAKKRHKRA